MMNISPAEFISISLSLPILSLNIISSLEIFPFSKLIFISNLYLRDVTRISSSQSENSLPL